MKPLVGTVILMGVGALAWMLCYYGNEQIFIEPPTPEEIEYTELGGLADGFSRNARFSCALAGIVFALALAAFVNWDENLGLNTKGKVIFIAFGGVVCSLMGIIILPYINGPYVNGQGTMGIGTIRFRGMAWFAQGLVSEALALLVSHIALGLGRANKEVAKALRSVADIGG